MNEFNEMLSNAVNDEVVIDFSGSTDFEPLPDGTFKATIVEATPVTSKAGNPCLKFVFEIAHKGGVYKRTRTAPISGKGAGLAKEVLKAAGLNVEGTSMRLKPSSVVGKKVDVTIAPQKNNPEYQEIRKVTASTSGLASL